MAIATLDSMGAGMRICKQLADVSLLNSYMGRILSASRKQVTFASSAKGIERVEAMDS